MRSGDRREKAGGGDGGKWGRASPAEQVNGRDLASRPGTSGLVSTAAISGQEYQDPAQVREHKVTCQYLAASRRHLPTLSVDTNCVTTIYLLSLLFLCHCDLDFDVKEAEKSTLIRNWIKTRQRVDNDINNNFVDCRNIKTSQLTSHWISRYAVQ